MSGFLAETDYSAGILPGTTGNADPWRAGVAGTAGVSLGDGTGQQGHTGIEGALMGGNPFVTIWAWFNKPLTTPLSLYDIGLIIGAILAALIFWNLVLYHIRIAAEAI